MQTVDTLAPYGARFGGSGSSGMALNQTEPPPISASRKRMALPTAPLLFSDSTPDGSRGILLGEFQQLYSTSNTDLGLYVHVPFCRHECPYCDFTKFSIQGKPMALRREFPEWVAREVELFPEFTPWLPVRTLYLGGGTPSLLVPESLRRLLTLLQERFGPAEEITLEANPENITASRLMQWAELGINRLSVGIQSFAERDLKRLERLHSRKSLEQTLELLAGGPLPNWSGDLMFALPGQRSADFLRNLEMLVGYGPRHISFYGLTYHEGTPFFREREAGTLLPAEEESEARMYEEGHSFLESVGFEHYEVSNFARPGYRSRHNQRYWSLSPVLGFGPGAWSQLGNLRWMVEDDYSTWTKCLQQGDSPWKNRETLTLVEQCKERLFAALRRSEGFALGSTDAESELLRSWLSTPQGVQVVENQWVEVQNSVRLTLQGWLRWDAMMASLGRHVEEKLGHG